MADMKRTANDIIRAMKEASKKKPSAYDTTAEVKRVENGTAWVHIPGGVDETPAALTIDASVGDTVQVKVSGGNAWIVGNQTAPPTSDKTAKEALAAATSAKAEIGSTMTGDVLHYLATDLDSGVTTDTPGWTNSPQAITEAKPYLWTYHAYTFANGNTVESVPVLTGVYGPKGEQGDPGTPGGKGDKGDTGVSVSTITTQYYLSTSQSSATGGSWGTSLPAYVSGRYYWTRERATYSDGSTKYSPSSSGVYSPGLTQACQLSYDTAQHFWTRNVSSPGNIPNGAYVTEQTESAYLSNPTGGATLIRSDKVDILVGNKTYSRFDGNGTHIYDGNGTAASNVLAEFTGSSAQVGKSNTGHVTMDSNGLVVYKGSVQAASFGTSAIIGGVHVGAYRIEISSTGITLLRKLSSGDETIAVLDGNGIKVCGHDSVIGTQLGPEMGDATVPNASQYDVPTSGMTRLTLTKGTWLVTGQASFAGTSGGGRRWMAIRQISPNGYTVPGSETNQAAIASSSAPTTLNTQAIVFTPETRTYTLRLAQNSGGNLYADTVIDAVRIV